MGSVEPAKTPPPASKPKPTKAKEEYIKVPVFQIDDPPIFMHPDISDRELEAMANSIRSQGQLQNITVRPSGDHYQLVIGHVRLLAARKFGITELWARRVDVDDATTLGMILTENLERSEHNPLSELQAIQVARDQLKLSVKQMHDKYGWSEAWIKERLSLLQLPAELLKHMAERKLSIGVALQLLKLPTPQEQVKFGVDFASNRATVQYAERLIATYIDYKTRVKREPTEEELAKMKIEPEIDCVFGHHRVKVSKLRVLQLCEECLEEVNYLRVKDKREQAKEPKPLPIIGVHGEITPDSPAEASNQ